MRHTVILRANGDREHAFLYLKEMLAQQNVRVPDLRESPEADPDALDAEFAAVR